MSLLMNAAAKGLLRKQLRGVSAGACVVLLRRVPGRESACRREPGWWWRESFCNTNWGLAFCSGRGGLGLRGLFDYVALAPGAGWKKQQTTFAREPSATRFFLACLLIALSTVTSAIRCKNTIPSEKNRMALVTLELRFCMAQGHKHLAASTYFYAPLYWRTEVEDRWFFFSPGFLFLLAARH